MTLVYSNGSHIDIRAESKDRWWTTGSAAILSVTAFSNEDGGGRLTPVLLSELALPDPPACVPLGPAVTTSRKELPVTALATRRPLPLMEAIALGLIFSLVLDASDLESSG